MEKKSISERIAHMVEYFHKGNKSAFAKTVGISNQSLGEIVGARQSAPSFAALQKISIAFPEVRLEWLLHGQGAMLSQQEKAQHQFSNFTETDKKDFTELLDQYIHSSEFNKHVLGKAADNVMMAHTYAVIDTPPRHPKGLLLSTRLSISEEDAEQLVLSGKIKAKKLVNSPGYRVSEQWVREYLANDFEEPNWPQEYLSESGEGFIKETQQDPEVPYRRTKQVKPSRK